MHSTNRKCTPLTFLFLCLLLLSPLLLADEIDQVTSLLKDVNLQFKGMASNKKISALDLDAMDKRFRSIIQNNSAIENLMRINSNGMVINEIASQATDHQMRNVSEQKWFLQVKSTRKPYYGLSRDSAGGTYFFWAWPMITDDTVFNGAISAKIRSSAILKMASIGESTPITISFNGTPVYKRFSDQISSVQIDTVILSKKSNIIIQSQLQKSSRNLNTDSTIGSEQSDRTEPEEQFTVLDTLTSQTPVNEMQPSSSSVSSHSDAPSPQVFKSSLVGKISPTKYLLQSKTLIIIAICLACSIILLLVMFSPKKRHKSYKLSQEKAIDSNTENKEESTTAPLNKNIPRIPELKSFTNTPDTKEIINKENMCNSDHSPKEDFEEETREINTDDPKYHNLKQNLDNRATEFNSTKALEEKIRKDLYREIHSQIMQWVVCESARLSGKIEELNERLAKSENGNPKEIEKIKSEAQQISKEIELFKTHLTDKNS